MAWNYDGSKSDSRTNCYITRKHGRMKLQYTGSESVFTQKQCCVMHNYCIHDVLYYRKLNHPNILALFGVVNDKRQKINYHDSLIIIIIIIKVDFSKTVELKKL